MKMQLQSVIVVFGLVLVSNGAFAKGKPIAVGGDGCFTFDDEFGDAAGSDALGPYCYVPRKFASHVDSNELRVEPLLNNRRDVTVDIQDCIDGDCLAVPDSGLYQLGRLVSLDDFQANIPVGETASVSMTLVFREGAGTYILNWGGTSAAACAGIATDLMNVTALDNNGDGRSDTWDYTTTGMARACLFLNTESASTYVATVEAPFGGVFTTFADTNGNKALSLGQAVPEPAAGSMMLYSLLMIALMVRRKR